MGHPQKAHLGGSNTKKCKNNDFCMGISSNIHFQVNLERVRIRDKRRRKNPKIRIRWNRGCFFRSLKIDPLYMYIAQALMWRWGIDIENFVQPQHVTIERMKEK